MSSKRIISCLYHSRLNNYYEHFTAIFVLTLMAPIFEVQGSKEIAQHYRNADYMINTVPSTDHATTNNIRNGENQTQWCKGIKSIIILKVLQMLIGNGSER